MVGVEILGLGRFGIWSLFVYSGVFGGRETQGMERNMLELKGLVLRTLMEWSKAAGVLVFSSALDFLESCNA